MAEMANAAALRAIRTALLAGGSQTFEVAAEQFPPTTLFPYVLMIFAGSSVPQETNLVQIDLTYLVKMVAENFSTAHDGAALIFERLNDSGVQDGSLPGYTPVVKLDGGSDWIIKSATVTESVSMIENVDNATLLYHAGVMCILQMERT